MASQKILVFVLVGSVACQNARTFPGFSVNTFTNDVQSTTTPIPILKFIDQHNNDGSYTYGYQSADGTYKLETRLATGEVKGKYGYVDSNGNLKEVSYGADSEKGFVPVITGAEISAPSVGESANNFIEVAPKPVLRSDLQEPVLRQKLRTGLPQARRKFANFESKEESGQRDIKIVNGRRAILKKRLRTKEEQEQQADLTEQQRSTQQLSTDQQLSREQQLAARQRQLDILEEQQSALVRLQKAQSSRTESSRAFPAGFQSATTGQSAAFSQLSNPYLSGVNMDTGSYTINY